MPYLFPEKYIADISSANAPTELYEALSRAARHIGFDHFALAYEQRSCGALGQNLLLHDYPAAWERLYLDFSLNGADPVRRAGEKAMSGFEWCHIEQYIPMTHSDRSMMKEGRLHGIGDGYTVPRHIPGDAGGSCTFAVRPDKILPRDMLHAAELLGAYALTTARAMCSSRAPPPFTCHPILSQRQRECVLWSARGKTAGEIATILNIGETTVIQHLKTARERYQVYNRHSLILHALFDGLIGFSDIFEWRSPP